MVLTTRDFDKWYKSASDTIYALTQAIPAWIKLLPRGRKTDEMVNGIVWDGVFEGKFEDKAYAEKVFHAHIEKVKAVIPPERLLVMEVKDGWEPLCAFLGCEVPDTPFPHVNETADFVKRIRMMKMLGWMPWVTLGAAALIAYLMFQ